MKKRLGMVLAVVTVMWVSMAFAEDEAVIQELQADDPVTK